MGAIQAGSPTERTGILMAVPSGTAIFIIEKKVTELMNELNLYNVDLKYIRDLHKSHSKERSNVMSQSPQINKETRCYIGIIVMVEGQKYCIPLTSGNKEKFKNKKSSVDMLKIPDLEHKNENGANKVLAVLNINNMIPVCDSVISKIDLHISYKNSHSDNQRKSLMQKELSWCRENSDLIIRRARKVYSLVVDSPDKNRNLVRRCCNFKKLEEVLAKRLEKEGIHNPSEQTSFKDTVTSMSKWSDNVQNAAAERDEQNKSKKER